MSCTQIVAQINNASLLIVHCRYDEAISKLSSMLDPLKLALTVYDYSAIINPKEDEKASTAAAAAAATTDDEETHAATNAKVSSSATVRPRRGAVAATKTTTPSQRREEEAVSKLAYKFYTYQFESPFLKTDIPDTRARRRGGGGRGNNSGSGNGTSRPTRTTGTSRSTRSTRSTTTTTTNNANISPPQELPPSPHEPKPPSKPKFVTASIYRPPLLIQIVDEDARLAPSLGTSSASAASVSFAVNMKKVCEMLSYVAIYNLALCHQMKVVQLAQQEQAEQQHQQQLGGGAMTSRGGDTSTSLSGAAALLLRGGGGFRSSVTARKRRKRMLLCLKKALGLYEHSHQILMNQQHHEELATGSKNTSHFILHKMVLVTNLGQIHHSLKDHAKGDLCMDHLVAIVTNVKQKEEPVVDTIFEGSRVMMQGFFTIAAPYTTRHDHAAAA